MVQEDDVLPRATEPPFLSALHAKNDTTNPFGYKLGESTENNKALLFFSGKEILQRSIFKLTRQFYLSIKSYFLTVYPLILLRSLRVYILKQLFFSISVNSGFRNIYLAAKKFSATVHLDFKE